MNVWNIAASFASGIISAMGFGGGGVLIIYLTQMLNNNQLNAQGINLIFFIPSAVTAMIIHMKNKMINLKEIKLYIISAIPGVVAGLFLTTVLNGTIIGKLFGLLLIVMGVREILNN